MSASSIFSTLAATAAAAIFAGAPAPAEPYEPADSLRYHDADAPAGSLDNDRWWERFADPELTALVERGARDSYELRAAASRIDEADAVILQARAPLLPTASIESSAAMAPFDSLGFGFGGGGGGLGGPNPDPPEVYYTASTALVVGVEVDLTGRNVLAHRASKRDAQASREDRHAQTIALRTRIARAYFDLVTAKEQLAAIEAQLAAQRATLELLEARFETTQSSALDVLQQRQAVATSETLVPQANTQIRVLEQQLAILVGSEPGEPIATANRLPDLPPLPPVGTPEELADRRPDLRAWSHRIAAAQARRKSAGRALAPSLRFTGQAGFQAIHITETDTQRFWTLGAALSIPLSKGGATLGRYRQVEAAEHTATHQLSQATLTAMQEVEEALARERELRVTLAAYERQRVAAAQALAQARELYISGQRDFLPVLAAQGATQQAELNLIATKRNLIAARIGLHAALGDSGQ